MRKVILFLALVCINLCAAAQENTIEHDISVQTRIDKIGFGILNANKIDKQITFAYNSKNNLLDEDSQVIKRRAVVSDKNLKFISTNEELAAYLSREIALARKSFDGHMGGVVSSLQTKMAPKKFEIVADKIAVDYMVKAGYNPLALITYIIKAFPQNRQDTISKHNLTSKRLAHIYEKIYFEYPYFLENNAYINNPFYQNFLLTSIENRRKLEFKVKSGSRGHIDYD